MPFLYMIDNIEAWDDLEELKKSNPNLGVSVSEEFYIEQIEIGKKRPFQRKWSFLQSIATSSKIPVWRGWITGTL